MNLSVCVVVLISLFLAIRSCFAGIPSSRMLREVHCKWTENSCTSRAIYKGCEVQIKMLTPYQLTFSHINHTTSTMKTVSLTCINFSFTMQCSCEYIHTGECVAKPCVYFVNFFALYRTVVPLFSWSKDFQVCLIWQK